MATTKLKGNEVTFMEQKCNVGDIATVVKCSSTRFIRHSSWWTKW